MLCGWHHSKCYTYYIPLLIRILTAAYEIETIMLSLFIGKDTEALRVQVICPKSLSSIK